MLRINETSDYLEADFESPHALPMINFAKVRFIAEIVLILRSCQLNTYDINAKPEILELLLHSTKYSDDDLRREISKQLE